MSSDGFLHLRPELLIEFLKCDDLVIETEAQVFEKVLEWFRFDQGNREQYVAAVMAKIRFPVMPKAYLKSNVETEPLLMDNARCQFYISEAHKPAMLHCYYPSSDNDLTKDNDPINNDDPMTINDPKYVKDTSRYLPRRSWQAFIMLIGGIDPNIELLDLSTNYWKYDAAAMLSPRC